MQLDDCSGECTAEGGGDGASGSGDEMAQLVVQLRELQVTVLLDSLRLALVSGHKVGGQPGCKQWSIKHLP